jgi:predicted transcriptional regulator
MPNKSSNLLNLKRLLVTSGAQLSGAGEPQAVLARKGTRHPAHGNVMLIRGQSVLGPLETKVLNVLWLKGRAVTVRHVLAAFPELAYTTLMTTLDRLYRKGVLIRRRRGRAFVYEPRCSLEQMLKERVSDQITSLLAAPGASSAILSTLVDCVVRKDAALLDELDALVQAERTRLKMSDE